MLSQVGVAGAQIAVRNEIPGIVDGPQFVGLGLLLHLSCCTEISRSNPEFLPLAHSLPQCVSLGRIFQRQRSLIEIAICYG